MAGRWPRAAGAGRPSGWHAALTGWQREAELRAGGPDLLARGPEVPAPIALPVPDHDSDSYNDHDSDSDSDSDSGNG